VQIRPLVDTDRDWVAEIIRDRWGAATVAGHGVVFTPHELPGFAVEERGEPVGLVTYVLDEGECEIVTIDSLAEGRGVGSALLAAVVDAARRAECRRVWLVTTNDNLPAIRFYQKRGFVIVALRRNAVTTSRALKPEIPQLGVDGIPIRDELELEFALDAAPDRLDPMRR
jgi:ribosomal protein S18 acetylase RimI-like enzyme